MVGTLFYDQLFSVPPEAVRNRSQAGGSVLASGSMRQNEGIQYTVMSEAQSRRPYFDMGQNGFSIKYPEVEKRPIDEDAND